MNLINKFFLCVLSLCLGVAGLFSSEWVNDYIGFDTPMSGYRYILRNFEAPLTDENEQKCLSFLKQKFPEDTIAADRVRQNDLADWMLQRSEHVNATVGVLFEVIYDESADLLWREFCIQKLAMAASQPGVSKSLEIECYRILEEMAIDARISFSGTALLGLYRLHMLNPKRLTGDTVLSLAENILKQSTFSMANKVTALQIAGLLGSSYALEYARTIIQSDENIQLRISAIALLSQRGDSKDMATIKNLTENKDLRLRQSSRIAVGKLENHPNN